MKILLLGVIFGASLQTMYVFYHKNKLLKLFELIEMKFEYSSQTNLQEITMDDYMKKAMYMIFWWGSVLVLAVVCLVIGPLTIKNQRLCPL